MTLCLIIEFFKIKNFFASKDTLKQVKRNEKNDPNNNILQRFIGGGLKKRKCRIMVQKLWAKKKKKY